MISLHIENGLLFVLSITYSVLNFERFMNDPIPMIQKHMSLIYVYIVGKCIV